MWEWGWWLGNGAGAGAGTGVGFESVNGSGVEGESGCGCVIVSRCEAGNTSETGHQRDHESASPSPSLERRPRSVQPPVPAPPAYPQTQDRLSSHR
jgi:hypothetical protein